VVVRDGFGGEGAAKDMRDGLAAGAVAPASGLRLGWWLRRQGLKGATRDGRERLAAGWEGGASTCKYN
jgi:hypothetical protein